MTRTLTDERLAGLVERCRDQIAARIAPEFWEDVEAALLELLRKRRGMRAIHDWCGEMVAAIHADDEPALARMMDRAGMGEEWENANRDRAASVRAADDGE